jgi:subtilisin family serine protease
VIAVAASTSQDTHAQYSNCGREISICAPSNGDWPILAARAWWDGGLTNETGIYKYYHDGRDRGNRYKHFGGTSSSTPLVAGICALILTANPDLTARQVKKILEQTADKIGSPHEYVNGHSVKYGYGRVNADRAVAEALRLRDQNTAPQPVQNTVTSGQGGLFVFDVKKETTPGWGVQVGAYSDYGNVLILTEKLKRQFGQPVLVNVSNVNGRSIYKVIVGNTDQNSARALQSRLKSGGYDGFVKNLEGMV